MLPAMAGWTVVDKKDEITDERIWVAFNVPPGRGIWRATFGVGCMEEELYIALSDVGPLVPNSVVHLRIGQEPPIELIPTTYSGSSHRLALGATKDHELVKALAAAKVPFVVRFDPEVSTSGTRKYESMGSRRLMEAPCLTDSPAKTEAANPIREKIKALLIQDGTDPEDPAVRKALGWD